MTSAFNRSRGEDCLSDLALDAIVSGDTPSDAQRAHLQSCTKCAERLDVIQREKLAFAGAHPPLPAKPKESMPSPLRLIVGTVAALAAALAIVLTTRVDRPQQDTIRIKGAGAKKVEHARTSFGFYVLHDGKVRSGTDGEVVHPKDALRFQYTSDTPLFVYVLSVDPESSVSVYYQSGDEPEPAGRGRAVEQSTRLDDTIGTEYIFGFLCSERVDPDLLKHEVTRVSEPPKVPPGCTVAKIRIEKTVRGDE